MTEEGEQNEDIKERIREEFASLSEEDQEKVFKLLENYLCSSDEVREMLMEDPEQTVKEFLALYGASDWEE